MLTKHCLLFIWKAACSSKESLCICKAILCSLFSHMENIVFVVFTIDCLLWIKARGPNLGFYLFMKEVLQHIDYSPRSLHNSIYLCRKFDDKFILKSIIVFIEANLLLKFVLVLLCFLKKNFTLLSNWVFLSTLI